MFDACFVHEKRNKRHSSIIGVITSDWQTFSKWKKFKSLKKLLKSSLWRKKVDLDEPIYFPHSDYCPVCTKCLGGYEVIPDDPIVWGECVWCKDSLNCECPYERDFYLQDFYVVAHIRNRPIIFQYVERREEDEQRCINEVKEILNLIKSKYDIGEIK